MKHQDTDDTLADIEEMATEGYLCSLGDYRRETDEYEVTWHNKLGRECGFWGGKRLLEQLFTEEILN